VSAVGPRRAGVVAAILVVVAGYVGYLLGGTHGAARTADASATSSTTPTRVPVTSSTVPPARRGHPRPAAPFPRLAKDLSIYPLTIPTASWERLLGLAQAAGANVISTDVSWAQLEPKGPAPAHEFAALDRFVTTVLARHMRLRFQIVGFPDWARDADQPPSWEAQWLPPAAPDELARWSAFLARLARHYRGKVAYYEIWDEPNISRFWYPIPSPDQYAALLEASYTAIKAAAPGAQVMFGGMAFNDVGFLTQTYDAIDQQFPRSATVDHHFFDILAIDPYTGGTSPAVNTKAQIYPDDFGLMNGNFLGFEQLHSVMVANGDASKRIYITEYGFTTIGSYGFPPVSDATRAQYVRTAWNLVRKIPYVIGFSWYCLYPNLPADDGFAILQGSGVHWQKSLTYQAFAALRL
jgi:hypothetical protein